MFSSCVKEPKACFTVDNVNPYVGEEVQFSNCSTEADSYVWNFDDGNSDGETDATHTYLLPGEYTVSLLALSENGDKDNFITQLISVTEPVDTGKVVFWRQGIAPFDCPSIEITLYFVPVGFLASGVITVLHTSAPDCNSSDALIIELPTDINYGWQVTNPQTGYTEDRPGFSVEKNGCLKLRAD